MAQINIRKPTVAIVIPNLNQGHFLEQAIQSIMKQSSLELFIAVMDAGSTDDSLSIIRKYSNYITYWRSHPDEGQAAAINEGIVNLPATDYVCWLNADDVFLENGLTTMAKHLEENNKCVAVYANAYITDSHNQIISYYPTEKFSVEGLAQSCFICQPATLIRSGAWNDVYGVDTSFHMCMDYDLWWRLSKIGCIDHIDSFTACSRDHEGTKTNNNKEKHYKEAFKLLKKHIGYVPLHWCVSMIREIKFKNTSVVTKIISKLAGGYLYLINKF
ncbi:glycosyltransferase [Paenibacillus sp. LMG 31456]|uniref:Glycosyltransferase n=1 Tax=Paenibacillus foliorum TaxID=2654974 RepID=A0A972GLL8_9BACL|nr:glycosyltransferase family 2 protein [Paenibacillus foliorum]NOU92967.1 glycosyltransferase [Paenibacillus foliorum]